MFRHVSFKENNYRVFLMKNRYEELLEINTKVNEIETISFNVKEPAKMSIKIPLYIERNIGVSDDQMDNPTYSPMVSRIENPLYGIIKGKMQIVLELNNIKYKFIVEEISETSNKSKSYKTVTCYEWHHTLNKINYAITDPVITRQLYRGNNQLEIADGVLDIFTQCCKGWSVGHVDQNARQELAMCATSRNIVWAENHTFVNVESKSTLLKNDISINIGEKPINMSISWDCEVYDAQDKLYLSTTSTHDFTGLPYAIKSIEAKQYSDEQYMHGIEYIITYIDNYTESFKFSFVNCKGLKLYAKTVNIVYETGDFAENWITKYRTFESQNCSWTTFLQQIEEAYDCTIVFDSYNQVIDVYDKGSFGIETGLWLTYDNALKEITKEKKIQDIVTRLTVESNNTSIASVNPLGTEYVESFKYFMNSNIMSTELKQAMEKYNLLLEQKDIEFNTLKTQSYNKNQELTLASSRYQSTQQKYISENAILTSYIKYKNDAAQEDKNAWATRQKNQQVIVVNLENEVKSLEAKLTTLQNELDAIDNAITQIGIDIAKENAVYNGTKLFNENLLLELSDYIIESSISDEVYLTANSLYEHAVKTLNDLQSVVIDFTINADVDFLKLLKTTNGFSDFIFLGAKIGIEDKSGEITDEDGTVTLYSFDYSPKTNKITNMSFTNNKEAPVSSLRAISNVTKTANATKSITDFYKTTWEQTRKQTVDVGKIITDGLDLAAQKIRSRTSSNVIDITEAGIFLIDARNEDNQLGMINDLICMTDDRWSTSRIAISPEGIIADHLIGKVILGQELYISNDEASFAIREGGLTIRDGNNNDRIYLGLNDDSQPTFKLGMNKNDDHLMWENGTLSIKANSVKTPNGDVLTTAEFSVLEDKIESKVSSINIGGENYIFNGDFSTGTIQPWHAERFSGSTSWSANVRNGTGDDWIPDGKHVGQIIADGINDSNREGEWTIRQDIPTVLGKTYTVSYYTAGHRGTMTARVRRGDNWHDIAQTKTYEGIVGGKNINNWTYDSITFTAESTTTSIWFSVVRVNSGNNAHMWIMDVCCVEGEIAQHFTPNTKEYMEITQSQITQTADEIKSTVSSNYTTLDSKFGNYPTTVQMNSAIQQKADEITSTVSMTKLVGIELLPQGYRGGGSTSGYSSISGGKLKCDEWGLYTTERAFVISDYIAVDSNLPIAYEYEITNADGTPLTFLGVEQYTGTKEEVGVNAATIYFLEDYFRGNRKDSGTLTLHSNTRYIRLRWLSDWNSTGMSYCQLSNISLKQLGSINTSTQIAQKTDSITSTVNANYTTLNNKFNDYPTTVQMNSAIKQQADSITSTVNANYTTLNNKFGNYPTTTQMNSAINQKADSITSSVSKTYATIDTTNGLGTRLSSAESSITQHANQIATKVDVNGVKSTIQQNPESVRIGFNGISNYFDLNSTRLQVGHADGSYTQIGQNGVTYYANGSGNRYHNLMKQGWIDAITMSNYGQNGWSTTITLPSEFKGKVFSVIPCLTYASCPNLADALKGFEVNIPQEHVNYNNGTFKIFIYAGGLWAEGLTIHYNVLIRMTWIAIA